jgi:hypothetical protein
VWASVARRSRVLLLLANSMTTTANDAPGNSTAMPLIEKKPFAGRAIGSAYATTSMLAFDARFAKVMRSPQQVTTPAFCKAFRRRLARCRSHPMSAESCRGQVGVPARLRSHSTAARLVERPGSTTHCVFRACESRGSAPRLPPHPSWAVTVPGSWGSRRWWAMSHALEPTRSIRRAGLAFVPAASSLCLA